MEYDRFDRTEWRAFPVIDGRVSATSRLLLRAPPPGYVNGDPTGESTTAAALRPDGTAIVAIAYAIGATSRFGSPGAVALLGGPLDRLRRIATVGRATPGPMVPRVDLAPDGTQTLLWTTWDALPRMDGLRRVGGRSSALPPSPSDTDTVALAVEGRWALLGTGEGCAHDQECVLLVRRL